MKWINIKNYCQKYQVSFSSLREKIQLKEIDFIFHDNQYKIRDVPLYESASFKEHLEGHDDLVQVDKKVRELRFKLQSKSREYEKLKNQFEDLNNLFKWIDKENQEMKQILQGLNRIQSYLKDDI